MHPQRKGGVGCVNTVSHTRVLVLALNRVRCTLLFAWSVAMAAGNHVGANKFGLDAEMYTGKDTKDRGESMVRGTDQEARFRLSAWGPAPASAACMHGNALLLPG